MHINKTIVRARGLGFTLIELLVVMGVIAILMALLVPAAMAVRKQVRIAQTQAMIDGMSMALDQYKQVYSTYPPDKATGLNANLDRSAECLVYYLSGASIYYNSTTNPNFRWAHTLYNISGLGVGRDSKTILYTFKLNSLNDTDNDKLPSVVDPWLKPFVYNSGTTTTNGTYNQYGMPVHNIGKYDLFSAGPDMICGTADDIKNWSDAATDTYNTITGSW